MSIFRLTTRDRLKDLIPRPVARPLRSLVRAWRRRAPKTRITNHFHTGYERNALVSFITHPFTAANPLMHLDVQEAQRIADAFHDLGYNVDVLSYDDDRPVGYKKYDVVFGFGHPVLNSYMSRREPVTVISYFRGMHNYVSNLATLKRIEDVHEKRNVWLLSSGRFASQDWTSVAKVSDAVFALGDDSVLESYRKYTDKPIFILPGIFHQVLDYRDVISQKDFGAASRSFLWFGGPGLIHKGLDLALEVFAQLPDLELHVCGPISGEPDFESCYSKELYETPNIRTHGYVAIGSQLFLDLLLRCAFTIFPSCAEGGPSSVLNVTGNGGLIPVVTREASIHVGDFGLEINALSEAAVREAVLNAAALSSHEIASRSRESGAYFTENHSVARYTNALRASLGEALL